MRKFFVVSSALLVCAIMAACSGIPTSPDGFNPDKPIDSNNRPPSPPGGMNLATATHTLLKDGVEIGTGNEFVLDNYEQEYTLRQCATHAGWKGRHIALTIDIKILGYKSMGPLMEGELSSPFCISQTFHMTFQGHTMQEFTANLRLNEDSYDISVPNVVNDVVRFTVGGSAPWSPPGVVARDDAYSMKLGEKLEVPAPGVLANDTYPAGATVSFSRYGLEGFTDLGGGGFILEVPSWLNFRGTITLPYQIRTPAGSSNPATATVTVS